MSAVLSLTIEFARRSPKTFGGPVARTIGELDLGRQGMIQISVKGHRLERRDALSPEVGVELLTSNEYGLQLAPDPTNAYTSVGRGTTNSGGTDGSGSISRVIPRTVAW
ncbi:MAG: hypothetical protein E6J74_11145 [Deltaproteobacteria bacterium]|nr:MAG: hypothetical protein E6J74_11145 [Deltaproteobacteria bacterium]